MVIGYEFSILICVECVFSLVSVVCIVGLLIWLVRLMKKLYFYLVLCDGCDLMWFMLMLCCVNGLSMLNRVLGLLWMNISIEVWLWLDVGKMVWFMIRKCVVLLVLFWIGLVMIFFRLYMCLVFLLLMVVVLLVLWVWWVFLVLFDIGIFLVLGRLVCSYEEVCMNDWGWLYMCLILFSWLLCDIRYCCMCSFILL